MWKVTGSLKVCRPLRLLTCNPVECPSDVVVGDRDVVLLDLPSTVFVSLNITV